jgi:hypothetical protein
VSLGDVVDQLHNQHGLADTSTTEETDFTTSSVGSKQINNLDTSDENLLTGRLLNEQRRVTVNGKTNIRVDGSSLIDGLTNDVHNATKGSRADGHSDGGTSILDLLATNQTISVVHSNCTDNVVAEVLCNFENQTNVVVVDLESVENERNLVGEFNVNDGTDNLHNAAEVLRVGKVVVGVLHALRRGEKVLEAGFAGGRADDIRG